MNSSTNTALQRSLIRPRWPAPANVHACVSTKKGGHSLRSYASLNLADHVGDKPEHVRANRETFLQALAVTAPPIWLQQIHGTTVLDLDSVLSGTALDSESDSERSSICEPYVADGVTTTLSGQLCIVQTADCLPVLLCDAKGTKVAAIHAGWRGLADGILQEALAAFDQKTVYAWLGPAIGPRCFEVGEEVRARFIESDPAAESEFGLIKPKVGACVPGEPAWLANLYGLASQQLRKLGVSSISGGDHCTYTQVELFYSYRREGVCGRMACAIWLD